MKYLKKITLENFQSHKYTEIDFTEGLNIIVGPSDTGKTAIIRGLKWVLYNEPSGDYFIREGENECRVEVEFNNGVKLKRIRSRSKNIYMLIGRDGEEVRFEGFGTSVPQEIIDEIGIQKIYLDDLESTPINLGEQLDGAFLLSERASVRASAIGRLIGVNIVDDALKISLRDLRTLTLDKNNKESNISKLKTELEDFEYLDQLNENLQKVKSIKNLIKSKLELRLNFIKLSKKYKEVQEEILSIKKELSLYEDLNKTEELLANMESLSKKNLYYKDLKEKYKINSKEIALNQGLLDSLKNIDKIDNIYLSLISLKNKYENLHQRNGKLISYRKQIQENYKVLNKVKKIDDLNILLEDYSQDNNKLKLLITYRDNLGTIQEKINMGTNYIDKFKNIELYNYRISSLEESCKLLNKLNDIKKKFQKSQIQILEAKTFIKDNNEVLNKHKDQYKFLLEKVKVCPYCFSKVDIKSIEDIVENNY